MSTDDLLQGGPRAPDPESVAALLGLIEKQLDDERLRGQGLDAKMSTVAGFTGAILVLTATVAQSLLTLHREVLGRTATRAIFVATIVLLAASAVCAVWSALRPRPHLVIDERHLREFTFSKLGAPRADIHGEFLQTLFGMLEHERAANDRKARLGAFAGLLLIVGLVCVGLLGVVLGLGIA